MDVSKLIERLHRHAALQAELAEAVEVVRGLEKTCLANDFNEHWDEYKAATAFLQKHTPEDTNG